MTYRSANLGTVWSAIAVVATVSAAAVIWHHLPTPTDLYGPFDIRGAAGDRVQGRALAATVTSIRVAPQVNSVKAAGDWVVVDTILEATRTTELPRADLVVGPNRYLPSDRFFGKTLMAEISPGITQRGSWVFDVASALVAEDATAPITLRVWVGSDILDSRLVIDVSAGDPRIARAGDVELGAPELSAQ